MYRNKEESSEQVNGHEVGYYSVIKTDDGSESDSFYWDGSNVDKTPIDCAVRREKATIKNETPSGIYLPTIIQEKSGFKIIPDSWEGRPELPTETYRVKFVTDQFGFSPFRALEECQDPEIIGYKRIMEKALKENHPSVRISKGSGQMIFDERTGLMSLALSTKPDCAKNQMEAAGLIHPDG